MLVDGKIACKLSSRQSVEHVYAPLIQAYKIFSSSLERKTNYSDFVMYIIDETCTSLLPHERPYLDGIFTSPDG